MIPISACYTSGRGAPHVLGFGRCTISLAHFVRPSPTLVRVGDMHRNKFKTELSAEFPGIVGNKGTTEKARCGHCGTDFGIGHGERSDVKRHMETEGHRDAVVDAKQTGR